ncbi:MAG: hypothetical protein HYX96_06165 [Chloroflexi bacterium]|nr:hypothetical protein [Chloroflexota bacterium]
MKGKSTPVVQDMAVVRSQDIVQLLDHLIVNNTTPRQSEAVDCAAFRRFLLYLGIDSTSTPTDVRIEVQFLDRWTGAWHTYKQGPFASMYFEDQDTASGVYECFEGECMGRALRLKVTGSGTSGSAYFDISAAVEFRN